MKKRFCTKRSGGSCRAATTFACGAGTSGAARPAALEIFRRLTLRSATEFSQRENCHPRFRGGRNLDKTAALMTEAEITETVKMTEKYVLTFVEKRGKLSKSEESLKFSKLHHSIKKLSDL